MLAAAGLATARKVDGEWEVVSLGAGESVDIDVALDAELEVWADETEIELVDQSEELDCEVPPTTTTPPTTTPPTTTTPPVEVLQATETAPELAFTGAQTSRNLGIGASFLAVGAALLAVTRRRRDED